MNNSLPTSLIPFSRSYPATYCTASLYGSVIVICNELKTLSPSRSILRSWTPFPPQSCQSHPYRSNAHAAPHGSPGMDPARRARTVALKLAAARRAHRTMDLSPAPGRPWSRCSHQTCHQSRSHSLRYTSLLLPAAALTASARIQSDPQLLCAALPCPPRPAKCRI